MLVTSLEDLRNNNLHGDTSLETITLNRKKLNTLYLKKTHEQGVFITLEGIDGSGKTTLAENLRSYYERNGVDVLLVREPGGTSIGENIRGILKNPEYTIDENQTLLLIYAARIALVNEVIKPALQEGKVVISDRFFHSTFAMQYWAGRCDETLFCYLTDQVALEVNPDVTLFLDTPLDVAAKHRKRQGQHDRFDDRDDSYHKRVREGYLILDSLYDDRYRRLPITEGDSPDQVAKKALQILKTVVPVDNKDDPNVSHPIRSFFNGFLSNIIR